MLQRTIIAALAGAGLGAWVWAQEGHPLTGAWHGTQGNNPIVVYMKWNNREVEGTLNPGRNAVPLKVTLEPATWTVRLEAQTKSGEPIRAEGKLGDIGSYNRTITGTWTQGGVKTDFRLRRD
jgi:hypothetical protein